MTDLSGDCGHAGEAVGEAAVDVVLFADGRDSLAVIDVRQIGLSLNNAITKFLKACPFKWNKLYIFCLDL